MNVEVYLRLLVNEYSILTLVLLRFRVPLSALVNYGKVLSLIGAAEAGKKESKSSSRLRMAGPSD